MYAEYEIANPMMCRLNEFAQQEVMKFQGREGIYNHNKVQSTLVGLMSEYAVRGLYRQGGVQAHMSQTARGFRDPDIVIPGGRTEEVKAWTLGYIWDTWGKTVKPSHAEFYEARGRERIWFCEADPSTGIVRVHGWATPAEVLESELIFTEGRFGDWNHSVQDLHRVSEVMPWVEETESTEGWW